MSGDPHQAADMGVDLDVSGSHADDPDLVAAMTHPSHPDQLMAQALGVCWHPPTAVLPPCEPLADWEVELLRPCGACGCTEAAHGATEGESSCRTHDCECDAFEPVERDSCGCDQDPIECNHKAALGEAEEKLRRWLEWLGDIGYGVDFTCSPPPPCEPRDLAEVYAERDGEPVADWVPILLDGNTSGGWYGNGRDEP